MPHLSGHEFRQAQTAITTYYIDRQNNFGLLYETPILGKPWVSILMEVPVYEWTVVGVSRLTGLPHFMAARTVSAACFYLTLPALYLLLGRLGLTRPRRLMASALVLTCPVYIYYSRAFLMDSMAVMFCAWFLLGFVRTMDQRSWAWLGLTIVTGTAAALIKSAVFAVWLWPAAGYGAWLLWRDLRAGADRWAPVRTALWGAGTVAVAFAALRAWIVYTDPIKAGHDSAWIFTSKNLAQGNWGLFDFKALFSRDVWHGLLRGWQLGVMPPWLIGIALAVGMMLRGARRWLLGIGGTFFLAQAMFPHAYADQDYYFYTCAIFLDVAVGCLLLALWDSRLPRWLVAVCFVIPFAAQLAAYNRGYLVDQKVHAQGGYPFTEALRDLTPKESVIVVAGVDWAAMIPYYAQRRALMVRNGLEHDHAYLDKAFARLADEDVWAVVLVDDLRRNRAFLEYAAQRFDFDFRAPAFSWVTADVYVPRRYRKAVQLGIKASRAYDQLTVPHCEEDDLPATGRFAIPASLGRNAFPNVVPAPEEAEFQFGPNWIVHGKGAALSAHPNSDLWLTPPPNATRIRWDYGIFDGAYAKPDNSTNGVEFIVDAEKPDGSSRRLFQRLLDPAKALGDRGDQHTEIAYVPQRGERLRFSTRPNGNFAFDWAYWIGIRVD